MASPTQPPSSSETSPTVNAMVMGMPARSASCVRATAASIASAVSSGSSAATTVPPSCARSSPPVTVKRAATTRAHAATSS